MGVDWKKMCNFVAEKSHSYNQTSRQEDCRAKI